MLLGIIVLVGWHAGSDVFALLLWQGIAAASAVWPKIIVVFNIAAGALLSVVVCQLLAGRRRQRQLEEEVKRRTRAESHAVRQTSLLRSILSSISEGVVVADEQGRLQIINDAAERLLFNGGLASCADRLDDEAVVRQLRERLPLRRAMQGERFADVEVYQQNSASGEERCLSVSGAPLCNEQGERMGGVINFRDITDSKAASQRLSKSEDRFQRAVTGTMDGLWDWNIASDEMWYAPRFAELLGCETDELDQVFETFESRLHPDDRAPTMEALRRHLAENVPYDVDFRLRTKAGAYRWFRARGVTTRDSEGQPLRMAGSIQDVHELKLARQAILETTDELSQANDELRRFTYTVSHDLKSPLVTISGFLGLLQRDMEQGDMTSACSRIDRIKTAAARMKQLLDDLAKLSRIGRIAQNVEDVVLGEVAQEAIELCAGLISQRGVEVQISSALPMVRGDRLRLREVFQNLVENAVKYSADQPHPRLEIGARATDGAGFGHETVCYVRDNGVGVDPKYASLVFEMFEQLDPRQPGTGMGLAIVKRIIEIHRGRVWIESEGVGKGCCVCFALPVAESD